MADRKDNLNRAEDKPQAPGQGGRMTEASPNPHNEAAMDASPIETDHSHRTEKTNVAQTPSTPGGNLIPSVGDAVAGAEADTDSMFNNADEQTREVRRSEKDTHDAHPRSPDRKSA